MASTASIPTHVVNDADGALSSSLKRLYDEMRMSDRDRKSLYKKHHIQRQAELESKRQRLGFGELQGVRRKTQKLLASFIDYNEQRGTMSSSGDEGIRNMDSSQFMYAFTSFSGQFKKRYSRFKACLRGYKKDDDEEFLTTLTDSQLIKLRDTVAERTTFNYLCPELRQMSWCQPVLRKFIDCLMKNLPATVTADVGSVDEEDDDDDDDSIVFDSNQHCIVCYGKTQSGKTGLKAVAAALCLELGIDFKVLTKGRPESLELTTKLKRYFSHCPAGNLSQHVISTLQYDTADAWSNNLHKIVNQFPNGGMILVAYDTDTQIGKAMQALKGVKRYFILAVDEADSMYRSKDETQKAEIAYASLRELGPNLTVMTTATPVSILGILQEEKKCPFELFSIETTENYVGLEDMEPLVDTNGVKQFLSCGVLKHDKGVVFRDDKIIPYTNDQTMMLYDDAVFDINSKKGILLLDITNPRVAEEETSIFTKADYVQRYYAEKDIPKQIVVVVNVGRGIYHRILGDVPGEWRWYGKGIKLSDVLNQLDQSGLHVPIFVFGFFKMTRGVSCRSDLRVPTHIVAALGPGYSIENMLQVLGRATFNGKSTLERNVGAVGAKVKVLTNKTDFEAVQVYQTFMTNLEAKCHVTNHGNNNADGPISSFRLVWPEAKANLEKELNVLTSRRLGQRPNDTVTS